MLFRSLQVGIRKRRIRQSEAEWKERLDVILFVASVANEKSFARRNSVWMRVDGEGEGPECWVVFNPLLERDRQFSGRIDVSKQDFGKCRSPVLARVKSFNQTRYLVNPLWRIEVSPTVKHHDHPMINRGEVLDQLILKFRERKRSIFTFTFVLVIDSCRKSPPHRTWQSLVELAE